MSKPISSGQGFGVPPSPNQSDGFDITWVGESHRDQILCLGSDDGRYTLARVTLPFIEGGPIQAVESRESINGVAFSKDRMAVSTRSEVVVMDLGREVKPAIYLGGAHGVVALARGRFVAPLGIGGLLLIQPWTATDQTGEFSTILPSDAINIYRVESLGTTLAGEDVLACAARDDGLLTIGLGSSGDVSRSNLLSIPDVDIVDVCSLRSPTLPFGVAALGRDRSIVLSRDVLTDRSPEHLSAVGREGTAYRILCSHGHLFLLTSEAMYVVPGFVSKFAEGSPIGGPGTILVKKFQAVDAYLAFDRIFIVLADHVSVLDPATVGSGLATDSSFARSEESLTKLPNGGFNSLAFPELSFTMSHPS